MKCLWFSIVPVAEGDAREGCWINAQMEAVSRHCPDVELAIAYTSSCTRQKRVGQVICYEMRPQAEGLWQRLATAMHHPGVEWTSIRQQALDVVRDFAPDVICCFGSEWPFGLIKAETKVPVVVHMQGFKTIYDRMWREVETDAMRFRLYHYHPVKVLRTWIRHAMEDLSHRRERRIMSLNTHYLGRTRWDRMLVSQYATQAHYHHCWEALREGIVTAQPWRMKPAGTKLQLVSISSAGELKGNGFILRTARQLKARGIDFEWKVAGRRQIFEKFEFYTGIRHEDVNVSPIGLIGADEIARLLAESHIYVHAACIDNSPNSLCEAQCIGCPVISTRVGGIPDLVEDGVTGLLVDYDDDAGLTDAIMRLAHDEALQQQLSLQERSIAQRRHDSQAIASTLYNIYNDIIHATE